MFTCISKTVNAALGMNPCSALKRIPVICRGWGGGHSAAISWPLHTARPLGVNSPALTTGDSWLVTSQVHQCFHSILSHKICPKCQIAVIYPTPPATERFHGDLCCYLHVRGENGNLWVVWEISTVWAVAISKSKWASHARLQCSTACVMYVQHRQRPFSKHLH